MGQEQPDRFDIIWRAALRGLMMLIVALLFFGVLFMVLLGNNWKADVAMLSAAALCAAFVVWRGLR